MHKSDGMLAVKHGDPRIWTYLDMLFAALCKYHQPDPTRYQRQSIREMGSARANTRYSPVGYENDLFSDDCGVFVESHI